MSTLDIQIKQFGLKVSDSKLFSSGKYLKVIRKLGFSKTDVKGHHVSNSNFCNKLDITYTVPLSIKALKVWERYGKGMEKVWERYGKGMGKAWERYGKGMVKVW